jgi:hypothetical protein
VLPGRSVIERPAEPSAIVDLLDESANATTGVVGAAAGAAVGFLLLQVFVELSTLALSQGLSTRLMLASMSRSRRIAR